MDRRTKIVVTLGPACEDERTIEQLLRAGANVVRLNFAHGTYETHGAHVASLRKACARLGLPATLLQDLQGPRIRTGEIAGGAVQLVAGQPFTLTTRSLIGDERRVSIDFPAFPKDLAPGSRILLDDGNLELEVISGGKGAIETRVLVGGELRPNKGVNLPHVHLDVPGFTEKDEADLAFGLARGVDAVAMSFVRSREDVSLLRRKIAQLAPERKDTPVIAKLEQPQALENLHEIIEAADGVMVARGDLGVELSMAEVPIAQKRIIAAANHLGKLVITATQMLNSMIHNPRPTRAEASDVANAIFDGSDAVMLSGETAIGKYPVQSVEVMDSIIRQAEAHLGEWGHWEGTPGAQETGEISPGAPTHDDALSITRAARELAHDLNVTAIAVFTMTGRTAQLMAKVRPRVPILAFTPEERTYRRLPMFWGVIPHLVPYVDTLEGMLQNVERALMAATPLKPGQQVVLISGFPVGARCPPNLALLHTLGKGG